MGKNRSHKRQRFEKPQPLGSASIALDDSTKDDEERRLESLLFGTQHTPRSRNDANILVISDDEGDERAVEGGNELQTILDSEVRIHISSFFSGLKLWFRSCSLSMMLARRTSNLILKSTSQSPLQRRRTNPRFMILKMNNKETIVQKTAKPRETNVLQYLSNPKRHLRGPIQMMSMYKYP